MKMLLKTKSLGEGRRKYKVDSYIVNFVVFYIEK